MILISLVMGLSNIFIIYLFYSAFMINLFPISLNRWYVYFQVSPGESRIKHVFDYLLQVKLSEAKHKETKIR